MQNPIDILCLSARYVVVLVWHLRQPHHDHYFSCQNAAPSRMSRKPLQWPSANILTWTVKNFVKSLKANLWRMRWLWKSSVSILVPCCTLRIEVFKSVGLPFFWPSTLGLWLSTYGYQLDLGSFMVTYRPLKPLWNLSLTWQHVAGGFTTSREFWRRSLSIDSLTQLCPSWICSKIAHITGDLQPMFRIMSTIRSSPPLEILKSMLDWLDL